jgi:hypothetical protein
MSDAALIGPRNNLETNSLETNSLETNSLETNSLETTQRGKAIYEQQIRRKVEIEANIGKIISIDIESGDYEIDRDLLTTCRRLQARHEHAVLWTERIGFNAVYAVGGTLIRTAL